MSGIQVSGNVLKVEHKAGKFTNDQGEQITYDYFLARILAGDEVVEVKFASDRPDLLPPDKGAQVVVEVELPGRVKSKAVAYASTVREVKSA
jgi:hypothetical protein